MNFKQYGFSLLEMSIVLLILIALAGLAMPFLGNTANFAQCQATDASLQTIKSVIVGGSSGPGFYNDLLGKLPRDEADTTRFNLACLFEQCNWPAYNSNTGYGWRGPYLQNGGPAPGGLGNDFTVAYDAITNPTGQVHLAINAGDANQILDAWGRPVVLQVPGLNDENLDARLVSAGPNGALDTTVADTNASNRGDDRILFLRRPDTGNNLPCGDL